MSYKNYNHELNEKKELITQRADSWNDNILNSLNNLQVYLDYMSLGAEDIIGMFKQKELNVNFAEVQNYNLRYFLNESRKLLTNSSKILGGEDEQKILLLLKELTDLNKSEGGFTISRRVNSEGTYQTFLKPSFNQARYICNKIRSYFVYGLWELLSPVAQDDKKLK